MKPFDVKSQFGTPLRNKDFLNIRSLSPPNQKINQIFAGEGGKKPSLFLKMGMDVMGGSNQKHGELSTKNKDKNQLDDSPPNYKLVNKLSQSIENLNISNGIIHKTPFNGGIHKEENKTNSISPLRKQEINHKHKKSKIKLSNKSNYEEEVIDYQKINNINVISKEEDLSIIFTAQDNVGSLLINVGECFIDLAANIDARLNTVTNTRRLLTSLKEELLNNKILFDFFSNISFNKMFENTLKLLAILTIVLKFLTTEFQYDNSIKTMIKKVTKPLAEVLINSIETFILSPLVSKGIVFRFETIDKYSKGLKFNKVKRPYTELIPYYNKNLDNAISAIKQISTSYFKIGFFRPVHNIILTFISQMDKFLTESLINLTSNNILFMYFKTNDYLNRQLFQNNSYFNSNLFLLPSVPFLPPIKNYTYTLVLDLDETLIHFFYTPSGGSFLIRPYCYEFIELLSTHYEIVIFTAAMKDYADTILDVINQDKNFIKHRLYRNHCAVTANGLVKDLSRIGRDLSKTLIIDNLPENFRMQYNNGLPIITWTDNMKDYQLKDLCHILLEIHKYQIHDVRPLIKRLKEDILKTRNVNSPYFRIDISRYL